MASVLSGKHRLRGLAIREKAAYRLNLLPDVDRIYLDRRGVRVTRGRISYAGAMERWAKGWWDKA